MVSVKEIAKHAGVSTATVSRVLNESSTVKEKNRKMVLQSIDELGYQINIQARSFRTNRSGNVIAILPNISNPLFAGIVSGLNNRMKELGYHVYIGTIEDDLQNVKPYLSMLYSRQADGIIFISKTFNEEILSNLKGVYPVVLCNEGLIDNTDFPLISIDNQKAGFEATKYLCNRGCKRIAFVAGRTTSLSTQQRINGYKQALEESNIPVCESNIIYGANSDIKETNLIKAFVQRSLCDGFIVNSDIKAALVLKSLISDLNYNINNIRLISFDGSYLSTLILPEFTTITQPMYEIGTNVAEMMVKRLGGEEVESIVMPYQLEIRDT